MNYFIFKQNCFTVGPAHRSVQAGSRPVWCLRRPVSWPVQAGTRPGHTPSQPALWPVQAGTRPGKWPRLPAVWPAQASAQAGVATMLTTATVVAAATAAVMQRGKGEGKMHRGEWSSPVERAVARSGRGRPRRPDSDADDSGERRPDLAVRSILLKGELAPLRDMLLLSSPPNPSVSPPARAWSPRRPRRSWLLTGQRCAARPAVLPAWPGHKAGWLGWWPGLVPAWTGQEAGRLRHQPGLEPA